MNRALLLTLLALMATQGTEAGTSTYTVELSHSVNSNNSCGITVASDSGNAPVLASSSVSESGGSVGSGSGFVEASAERGVLRAWTDVTANANPPFTYGFLGCTFSEMVIDDIVVSGPPGSVTTTLDVHVKGSVTNNSAFSRSDIRVRLKLEARDPVTGNLTAFTPLAIHDFSATVDTIASTASITFQSGDILTATASIEVTSGGTALGGDPTRDPVTSQIDFLDTVSFRDGVPVFSLPSGYTANSVDGAIVDNVFHGGDGISVQVAETAVPGEVELTWTGLGALFDVYRSTMPDVVIDPGNYLGQTGSKSWIDTPPETDQVNYYLVVRPD